MTKLEQMMAEEAKRQSYKTPEMVKERLEEKLGLFLIEKERVGDWRVTYELLSPTGIVLQEISVGLRTGQSSNRKGDEVKWWDIGGCGYVMSIGELMSMLQND